jgi:ADP-heptose:LPS heptosyltransferase/predicted SAM-dependent methyltransferase
MWKADNPEGNEAAKVRFDIVPYACGRGIDIGCGAEKVFDSFLGVDNCKDTQLFGIPIRPDLGAQAESLSMFAPEAFDCVFSSHTLEHIEDYQAALAEWWRILKVGGHLALYLPHADHYPRIGEPGANPDHKHDFVPDDIVSAMRALGGWDLVVNETRTQRDEYSFLQVYRKRAGYEQVELSEARPEKSLALVRLGAFGDALWLSSVLPHLKADGYHVTVYTQDPGEEVLRHDPNIDRIIKMPDYLFSGLNLVSYFLHEQRKYNRFLNLVGSIETRLLPTPKDFEFYWSDEVRRRVMNQNYLQTVHDWCGVPYEPRVRFHPTETERAVAIEARSRMAGPVAVLNPAGSGQFKWWPHWAQCAELLADRGVHVVVLGDAAGDRPPESERIHMVGRGGSIREALAFAQVADVVIGPESAITNAVSFEPMLKIVLLSHSTQENLTRDWPETVSIAVEGLDCYPCHRIHTSMETCTMDSVSRAAACQASIKPEQVADVVGEYLEWLTEQRKAA